MKRKAYSASPTDEMSDIDRDARGWADRMGLHWEDLNSESIIDRNDLRDFASKSRQEVLKESLQRSE